MDAKLLQMLEACRHDSGDVDAPAMQSLREALADDPSLDALRRQIEASDRRIAAALRDVEVPSDLADRIIARLEAERANAVGSALASTEAPAMVAIDSRRGPKLRRRRMLIGSTAAMVACAASLVSAWLLWPTKPESFGPEALMEMARSFYEPMTFEGAKLMTDEAPPVRYGVGPYVIADARTRWQSLGRKFAERKGVTYDLIARGGARARLFVVDLVGPMGATKIDAIADAPMHQVLATGGYASAVWTDGERVFVLVAEGDENTLRHFLRAPGAMA